MKSATAFKKALDVLKQVRFRNGVSINNVTYTADNEDQAVVTVRLHANQGLVAYCRMVEDATVKKLWVDEVQRIGIGDWLSRQHQRELAEDLILLGKAWEEKD